MSENQDKVVLLNKGRRQYDTTKGPLKPGQHLAFDKKEAKALSVYGDICPLAEYREPDSMKKLKSKLAAEKKKNADLTAKLEAGGDPEKGKEIDPEKVAAAKAKAEEEEKAKKKADAEAKAKKDADDAKKRRGGR